MKKITANELRVGNLIQLTGKSKSQVRVYKIHFELREGHLINGDIPEQYLEGISLTEEWLLNFGFNTNKSFGSRVIHAIGNLSIEIAHEQCFAYFRNEMINTFLHVHQLQNLFFALTGTELTLSPQTTTKT